MPIGAFAGPGREKGALTSSLRAGESFDMVCCTCVYIRRVCVCTCVYVVSFSSLVVRLSRQMLVLAQMRLLSSNWVYALDLVRRARLLVSSKQISSLLDQIIKV